MVDFEKSQTKINLARAFAGECQAGARYQFLGKNAISEKLHYIDTIMQELAKNEMAHANVFYKHLLNYGGNKLSNIDISAGYPFSPDNLKDGFKQSSLNELSEFKNIYPSFAKIAKDEGYFDISNSFILISEVEKEHFYKLSELDSKYKANKLYKFPQSKKWKCSKCGYERTSKSAWDNCPLCNAEKGYVEITFSSEPIKQNDIFLISIIES